MAFADINPKLKGSRYKAIYSLCCVTQLLKEHKFNMNDSFFLIISNKTHPCLIQCPMQSWSDSDMMSNLGMTFVVVLL